jgi:hypothetical protein
MLKATTTTVANPANPKFCIKLIAPSVSSGLSAESVVVGVLVASSSLVEVLVSVGSEVVLLVVEDEVVVGAEAFKVPHEFRPSVQRSSPSWVVERLMHWP